MDNDHLEKQMSFWVELTEEEKQDLLEKTGHPFEYHVAVNEKRKKLWGYDFLDDVMRWRSMYQCFDELTELTMTVVNCNEELRQHVRSLIIKNALLEKQLHNLEITRDQDAEAC